LVTAVALVVVFVLAAIQAAAAVREVRRVQRRVGEYANLPVLAPVRDAKKNATRLEVALGRIDPLMARADIALAQIRQGPVPPESIVAARRVWAAFLAFQSFAKR
jgi:hypothetical protein